MRLGFVLVFLLITPALITSAEPDPLRRSRQCLVVVAQNWNSTTGVLRPFEREQVGGEWRMVRGAIPVVLGKKGLGWGLGLLDPSETLGPRKIEGDDKAPAGVFRVDQAFGYAAEKNARWIKLAYYPLTKETEGIDDPRSRYYNRLVERSKVAPVDWRTSEKMLRGDALYKWGFVIAHNPTARPRVGSCIFFHIWKNSSSPTAGCTAMAERDLIDLLRWLDRAARPFLVQMPRGNYEAFQTKFDLPAWR